MKKYVVKFIIKLPSRINGACHEGKGEISFKLTTGLDEELLATEMLRVTEHLKQVTGHEITLKSTWIYF